MEARDLRRAAARALRPRGGRRGVSSLAAAARVRARACPISQAFAAQRGFVRRGGEIDYHNAAQSYISAFNDGTFGRISFESAGDDAQAA